MYTERVEDIKGVDANAFDNMFEILPGYRSKIPLDK
jgi:hypothetical protein